MEQQSPFLRMKRLEAQLTAILARIDIYALDRPEQKLATALKRDVVDARLDVRDYELSETRQEQLQNAQVAKERLQQLQRTILAMNQHIFSPADVAQLTAQIEQVAAGLY